MYRIFLLSTIAFPLFAASPLIFGGRGGAGFNTGETMIGSATGLSSRQYLVGPTAGVRLPLGFSVEGDALFERQTLSLPSMGLLNGLGTHADAWEFPVMLKFTAGHAVVAPVFGAGVSVRHLDNFGSVPSFLLSGSTTSNAVGFVAGAGLRFKAGPLDITPEVRFTHWNSGNLAQSLLNAIVPNSNQAEMLVGITF